MCTFQKTNSLVPPWARHILHRGAQICQQSRSHCKILCTRGVAWSRFHTEDPQILGATVQNLVTQVTWCQGLVQAHSQWGATGCNIWMHPPEICKISKTNMVISPQKICDTLLHPHVASVEPPWVETTHFQKRMYTQDVLCIVIERVV
jgi:hypothetical protein